MAFLVARRPPLHEFAVIHLHLSGHFIPLIVGFLIRLLEPTTPLVVTVHCSRNGYSPITYLDRVFSAALERLELGLLRATTFNIVLSDERRLDYAAHGIESIVLGDCIDLAYFDKNSNHTPESANHRDLLIYCGRLSVEKGVQGMLHSLRQLLVQRHDLSLRIIGDGPEREVIENYVVNNGLSHKVTITGFVDRYTLVDHLMSSSLVILPSKHEEFGGLILEAGACRKIVVSTRTIGTKEDQPELRE